MAVPSLDLIREWDYDQYHDRVYHAYGIKLQYGHGHFSYYKAGPSEKDQSELYATASDLGNSDLGNTQLCGILDSTVNCMVYCGIRGSFIVERNGIA